MTDIDDAYLAERGRHSRDGDRRMTDFSRLLLEFTLANETSNNWKIAVCAWIAREMGVADASM